MELDRNIDITAKQRKTVLALLEKASAEHRRLGLWLPRPNGPRVRNPISIWWFSQRRCKPAGFPTSGKRLRRATCRSGWTLFVWDAVPEQFRKRIEAEHVVLRSIQMSRAQ